MASKFKIGQEVIVSTKQIADKKGIIRFIGKIDGKTDQYVGVQLDEPSGKNSGDFDGKSYFKVEKKSDKGQFYGVFVKSVSIKLVTVQAPKKLANPRPSKAPTLQAPVSQGKNKLANELLEQQNNELQTIKEELEVAYERIRELEELDTVKQVESLKGRLKEYEEINRALKLEMENVRYQTDSNQDVKLKELADKLAFFQNQKDAGEREKSQLRKKIQRLELQLQEGADREQMLEKLTIKIETLQTKNQKLKSDLQSSSTQLKNAQMLGSGKASEQLQQSLTTLNEMVAMLESDLQQEREKKTLLQQQLQSNATRLNQLVKLERRLKSKDEEVEMLKIELQTLSDAANFVQNLTFANLKKDQQLKQQTKRLKQFAEKVNKLQTDWSEGQEMIELQGQEMEHLQEQIKKHLKDLQQRAKHVQLLNDQIAKYKQRIRQLTDNNSSLLLNMEEKDDESMLRNYFSTDLYQHKYYQLSRLHQSTSASYLQYQLQNSNARQYAGTFLANLIDTLPEAFTSRLHPHLLALLLRITGANHKLYLLFESVAGALTNRSQLYTAEQEDMVAWFLLLLDQLPVLYGSLLKLEFALISADGVEDVSQIFSHPDLKDKVTSIDIFTEQLLHKLTTETIDADIGFDVYIEAVQILDKVSLQVKRLPTQLATRLELCVETMRGVQQLLSSVEAYRRNSQARETAQVDTMLENFLKILQGYLRECCTRPHLFLKKDMRSYLSGVDLIVKILKQIELNDNLQELSSLYSETEDIRMLKDTVLTTQFHLKELTNALDEQNYPTPLSRIRVPLPGRLWQDKLRQMRQELGRFESTLADKLQLERVNAQQKRKILILEKEIKDRQSTKQLYERRIGELQLKVQQAALVQSDFKRQGEKLRSLEEAYKLIEDQVDNQGRRKKQLEEQLKKTKEKFDIFQTEAMVKQKKQKAANNLTTQDLSNLTIFKSVVAQAGALRNHNSKRKLHELAFSPILAIPQVNVKNNNRRQILNSLANLKIGDCTTKIEQQLSQANFGLKESAKQEYLVGHLTLREIERGTLTIDLNSRCITSC